VALIPAACKRFLSASGPRERWLARTERFIKNGDARAVLP
jgi:hypothetical protein